MFSWSGDLPVEIPPGLIRAGAMVAGQWEPGMICYGVPVGSDSYVHQKLHEKVVEVEVEVEEISQVLEGERQALWSVLRSPISQKFDYWLSLVYPSQIKAAAESMDRVVLGVLEKLVGGNILMQDEGLGWDCPVQSRFQ